MPIYLIRKFTAYGPLTVEDREALQKLASKRRHIGPRQDIICEGDNPEHVNVILAGWACRYKQLADGRRQIIALLLPGDLCDSHISILRAMDHSIGSITAVTLAKISRSELGHITDRSTNITHALNQDALVTIAIQREWTVNIGKRLALERLGHLLCEIFLRLHNVGLTEGTTCPLPLTQSDLGEALGQSSVHINRTLQELRSRGLITLGERQLTILDLPALRRVALFNPNYLHLNPVEHRQDICEEKEASMGS